LVVDRIFDKITSLGQGTAGVCGDMLFSGHTMIATFSVLFANRYTPKTHRLFVMCIMWPLLITTVVLLLTAHAHYTVDIVFGYWIAVGLFVIYHLHCETHHNKRALSEANTLLITKMFTFLECNTPSGRIPNKYNNPLPWPVTVNDWLQSMTTSDYVRTSRQHSPTNSMNGSVRRPSSVNLPVQEQQPPTMHTPLSPTRRPPSLPGSTHRDSYNSHDETDRR